MGCLELTVTATEDSIEPHRFSRRASERGCGCVKAQIQDAAGLEVSVLRTAFPKSAGQIGPPGSIGSRHWRRPPPGNEFRPSPPLNSRANHCGTASTGPAALRGSSPAGHLPLLQFEQVTAHDASPANYSSIRPTTQWFLPLLLRLGRIAFPFPYLHLRVHPTQPPSKWPHSCLKTTQNSYKAVACISCPAPLPASSPLPARPPIGSHLPSLGGHRRSARSIRRRCMDEWLMDSGG